MFMIKLGFDLYLVVIWYLTSGLLVIRDISSLQVKNVLNPFVSHWFASIKDHL